MIGPSCSGKTTTAGRLAAILGVPFLELDALHHDANWTEAPAELLQKRVREALAAAPDGWVVDGNYYGKLGPLVIDQADTIVWLDIPYGKAVWRVVRRTFVRILRGTSSGTGTASHCATRWVGSPSSGGCSAGTVASAQRWAGRLEGRNVVRVTEVERFLQSIQPIESMSGSSNGSDRQKTPPLAET